MALMAATRSARLRAMLDWADENDVNLDHASLLPQYGRFEFTHRNETAHNMRNVKRAVGKFETQGQPPYIELEAKFEYQGVAMKVRYSGAFECNITHHCEPAKFEDGTQLLDES